MHKKPPPRNPDDTLMALQQELQTNLIDRGAALLEEANQLDIRVKTVLADPTAAVTYVVDPNFLPHYHLFSIELNVFVILYNTEVRPKMEQLHAINRRQLGKSKPLPRHTIRMKALFTQLLDAYRERIMPQQASFRSSIDVLLADEAAIKKRLAERRLEPQPSPEQRQSSPEQQQPSSDQQQSSSDQHQSSSDQRQSSSEQQQSSPEQQQPSPEQQQPGPTAEPQPITE